MFEFIPYMDPSFSPYDMGPITWAIQHGPCYMAHIICPYKIKGSKSSKYCSAFFQSLWSYLAFFEAWKLAYFWTNIVQTWNEKINKLTSIEILKSRIQQKQRNLQQFFLAESISCSVLRWSLNSVRRAML